MIIWLIGFMGSGKSTVGRHLADTLAWQFVDTDELIVRKFGKSIAAIFLEYGEGGFRSMEEELFLELLGMQSTVIATGGGFPFQSGRMDKMKASGTVIHLAASVPVLLERLDNQSAERPLIAGLAGEGLEEKIRELLSTRTETYRQADVTINSDAAAVDRIMSFLGSI